MNENEHRAEKAATAVISGRVSQQDKTGLPGDPSRSVSGNQDRNVRWSDRQTAIRIYHTALKA